MIELRLVITNEAAEACEAELATFLKAETDRMMAYKPGTFDPATRTYAALRPLLNQLREHRKKLEAINAAEAKEREKRALENRPSVAQQRRA